MPEDNTNTTQPIINPVATNDASVSDAPAPIIPNDGTMPAPVPDVLAPAVPEDTVTTPEDQPTENSGIISEVATKIAEAHNILVALSSDPSVDEMSAAIGLTLFLDKIGKRVTAIYSGNTPNALEFLKPEETFEQNADILQDFVIALNKEKADHLRYKLDGDYVKIFITPYRSRISNEDLEFSYGDFNVDLVLALDVANGVDLDAALREHGRIMHDASVVNITTGKPGKLGEIEWSDKTASSVSEMIVELLYAMSGKDGISKEEATAFLTGIVAATNRFANASTTPKTMEIASHLMESGANQQLISKNITPDIDNEFLRFTNVTEKVDQDPTKLDIEHGNEENVDETKQVEATVTEKESTLLEDLKAAEASLANAGAEVTPEAVAEPLRIDGSDESFNEEPAASQESPSLVPDSLPPVVSQISPEPAMENNTSDAGAPDIQSEKTITPTDDFAAGPLDEGTNKYGQMLEDALAEGGADLAPTTPVISTEEPTAEVSALNEIPAPAEPAAPVNPAASIAPPVAAGPEINGVPEINYMPMPGDEVLPPPPTPPVDFSDVAAPAPETMPPIDTMPAPEAMPAPADTIAPAAPTPEPAPTPLGQQPAMQDQVYAPQVANPGAFKIPGM